MVAKTKAWLFVVFAFYLKELAKLSLAKGVTLPSLKEIRAMGELLTDPVRELCRQAWGVEIVDTYSSQEVGYIASQCPESGSYHIHSDSVMVEILDEAGQPCAPGEVGRVIVTSLLNLGAPLIRYDIGDYAAMGNACSCGRGSPVLEKIMGRQRNMMRLPDGRVSWPCFRATYIHVDKVQQIQLEQTEPDHLLIRLVVSQPMDKSEEQVLAAMFKERFDFDFRFSFEYLSKIPRAKSGKFEEFIYAVT